jgi:hypothetical protein
MQKPIYPNALVEQQRESVPAWLQRHAAEPVVHSTVNPLRNPGDMPSEYAMVRHVN